jgi:prepilin-type N-terminal cleavage/methylation domain-containing protein
MHGRESGFTLVELLVVMVVSGVIMAGVVTGFRVQQEAYRQQESLVAAEQNLRVAMSTVKDKLRTSGYAIPGQLDRWMPWAGIARNPEVFTDSISVAYCSPEPVAIMTSDAAVGDATLTVTSASEEKIVSEELRESDLVMIDGRVPARVSNVSNASVDIDTDINNNGLQGITRPYPAGTPICRVDVYTFSIEQSLTGESALIMNNYRDKVSIAEGINGLQITQTGMEEYQITLTALTSKASPFSGERITRSLTATVPVKN